MYQQEEKCNVRICLCIRVFSIFCYPHKREENARKQNTRFKRQFFLARPRDRNHFSFSLVVKKNNFFVEVLKICSFRKCNSHKFDRGLLFGTMVWPQNSYSIKVHIFDCFSSVHHLLWILNRKVHRERKVTLSCNWNISSHKDIFRMI